MVINNCALNLISYCFSSEQFNRSHPKESVVGVKIRLGCEPVATAILCSGGPRDRHDLWGLLALEKGVRVVLSPF